MASTPTRRRGAAPGSAGAPPLDANVAELRALAHPLRLRMLELFAEAARTTKQVAELLGEPPTRLYHHVAAMERAGLLALRETRRNRGATEKWYQAIATQFPATGAATGKGGGGRAARRAAALTVMEQARREVVAATDRDAPEPIVLVRLLVTTPRGDLPRLRQQLLDALRAIQHDAQCERPTGDERPAPVGERWALTVAFAPAPAREERPRPGARARRKK